MAITRPDILPKTGKAMKLRTLIRDLMDMSYRRISENFPIWDRLEEHYRIYRPEDSADKESMQKNRVKKIIVPIQFATVQSVATFLMEVFTALKPVLRVRGGDPRSVRPARVQELLLDYDYRGNRGYFTMEQWFLNSARYGYGIIENAWGSTTVTKQILKRQPSRGTLEIEGQEFQIPGPMEFVKAYFTTFEGNQWQIVDNRSWFPDPRVPLSRFQEGKFCGKRSFIHSNDIRRMEAADLFFNVDEVKMRPGVSTPLSSKMAETGMEDNRRSRISPNRALELELGEAKKNKMHLNEQVIIELIPKDYELSDSEEPEHYIFNLIDDYVIVRAEPSPFYRFNYEIVEAYPDVLAEMSMGVMELCEPLARHLDFTINSHLDNVRKAIHDQLLVDPSRVDLRDLLDPTAGKIIRLLPRAYGQDPAAAVKQLLISDVTQGHLNDAKLIMDIWNRVVGISDQMYGQISLSKRTAYEMQGVMKGAASRMKKMADSMSAEGVSPLTEQMSILRQENMSMEQFIELVGYSAMDLGVTPDQIIDGWARVTRDHIQGNFHFPAEEGVLPADRAAAAEMFQKIFETVVKVPHLQQFDPVEIFKEAVRQRGIHNIDDFLRKGLRAAPQIMPNDQVSELAARGQIVPSEVGRPNQGVREGAQGMTLEGAALGAGNGLGT